MQGQYIATGTLIGIALGVFFPIFYPIQMDDLHILILHILVNSGIILSKDSIDIVFFITTYLLLPLFTGFLGGVSGYWFYKFTQFR